MSHDTNEIDVEVTVHNHDLTDTQRRVVNVYERVIETCIRKDTDYGSSFEDSGKIESIMKYGEVREELLPDIFSRQIFVRGFLDKINRFYQLQFVNDDQMVDDEDITDTLLDLGNYSIMLAALLEKYGGNDDST